MPLPKVLLDHVQKATHEDHQPLRLRFRQRAHEREQLVRDIQHLRRDRLVACLGLVGILSTMRDFVDRYVMRRGPPGRSGRGDLVEGMGG